LEANKLRHGYLAAVSFADGLVGKILNKVSNLGLDDNTIVVIWSDHGFKLGDHGGWAKHSTVELDIHIPMMIRAPGMKASGARTAALVETVDIYPTLIDLAGLSEPHVLEGTSMRPLLNKPQQMWKQAVFAQYPRHVKKQSLMGETVRSQRYRYTAWVEEVSGRIVAQELYDHEMDPIESSNVAKNNDYFPELQHLEKLRQRGWQEVRRALHEQPTENQKIIN
jgi:arylsulfatase A-like enzyme